MFKFLALLSVACIIWAVPIKPKDRIFNGSTASDAQFPFQAYIKVTKENGNDLNCAGAILSNVWIITSGYCLFGARVVNVQVGSNTIFTSDPHRMQSLADKFYIPDGYDGEDQSNQYRRDIGLIRLKTPLVYNEFIRPIAIDTVDLGDQIVVTATGWGSIKQNGQQTTNYLQYAPLRIISNTECSQSYTSNTFNDDLVCARSTSSRVKSICIGDEGAPLVRDASTKPLLVGIGVLWSSRGCGDDRPSGFTRVYNYANWIKQITGLGF